MEQTKTKPAGNYDVVGKVMRGPKTIGYTISSGGKELTVKDDVMAFLVGKGVINNCTGQLYEDDVLYRGQNGFDFRSLPIKRIGGEESTQRSKESKKGNVSDAVNKDDNSAEHKLAISTIKQLFDIIKQEAYNSSQSHTEIGTDIVFKKSKDFPSGDVYRVLMYRQPQNITISLLQDNKEIRSYGINTLENLNGLNQWVNETTKNITQHVQ